MCVCVTHIYSLRQSLIRFSSWWFQLDTDYIRLIRPCSGTFQRNTTGTAFSTSGFRVDRNLSMEENRKNIKVTFLLYQIVLFCTKNSKTRLFCTCSYSSHIFRLNPQKCEFVSRAGMSKVFSISSRLLAHTTRQTYVDVRTSWTPTKLHLFQNYLII